MVCPVGDADKVMVSVVSIGDCRIIGVNNLGKVTNRIILVTDNLAIGIGIAQYTVESIVGSGDRAVAVVYGQYVTVGVVGVEILVSLTFRSRLTKDVKNGLPK